MNVEVAGFPNKFKQLQSFYGWSVQESADIKNLLETEKEICICAAVTTTDGEIIRGHRHHHCLQLIRDLGAKPSEKQGFITSKNRYVDREEGLRLQLEAGILSADPDGYRGRELYSEDLY